MEGRSPTDRGQRRVFATAMILSVALHAVAFAFVRLGIPVIPGGERAAAEDGPAERYLRHRPLRVVRLPTQAPVTGSPAADARDATPTGRTSPDPDPAAAPRLAVAGSALDLREVVERGEGVEIVAIRSPAEAAAGASADLNDGVVFEPASRAARNAGRREGRERERGGGSGIGIAILGPGGGECDILPGGRLPVPTGIVDNFVGRPAGAPGGGR